MIIALSVPQIQLNGNTMAIAPNSLKFKMGYGETNTRSVSLGNFASDTVHTVNAEEMVGSGSFDVANTKEYRSLFIDGKQNTGQNEIYATQKLPNGASEINVFTDVSLTNDPEWEAGADSFVTIEFKGARMIAQ